jgi:hypothetical protein
MKGGRMEKQPSPGMALVMLALAVLAGGFACVNPQAAAPPIDTTAPTGTITINNGDSYAASESVTLGLSAEDDSGSSGMQMMVSNAADFAGSVWQSYTESKAWTLTSGDGPKIVYAMFRDPAGNASPAYSDAIELDSTPPDPPGLPDLASADDTGLSDNDNFTRQTGALSFSGSGVEAGAAVRLYDPVLGLLGEATANLSGAWGLDLDLAEGTYTLLARVVDALGRESPSSPPLVVIVDTTPPAGVPGILKPAPGENTGTNTRPVFSWRAAADADAYELQADDSPDFGSIDYEWSNLSGTSYTPASKLDASGAVPVGTRYYLRLRALDAAGNAGSWSNGSALRYVNVGRFDNDFNGDGYADAIVGAYGYGSNQGRAYIYYGGPSMDNAADITMSGSAGSFFGYSVASAGDVNSDGYADAIVGAYSYGSGAGRAYIYYGGASMDNVAEVTLPGSGYRFGTSVAAAGDVNADGFADVIVGAEAYSSNTGQAYIYYGGGSSMDTDADVTMTGQASQNYFGFSVASAGDVNGDGFADAIVGGHRYFFGTGRAYIYYGGSLMNPNPDADVIMDGESTSQSFGYSVASAGDVNGDGYADAIVGGYNMQPGRAYIYYGGIDIELNPAANVTMLGESPFDDYGVSVASAGDVNRDGYADALVGAPAWGSNNGRAYIYYGGAAMNPVADVPPLTGEAGDRLGVSVAQAGDLNADGYPDVIVGANLYSGSQGRAQIYYSGATMDNSADLTLTGEADDNNFGYSVASVDFSRRRAGRWN